MNKRVSTQNKLHDELYNPEKHCTTGFKQLGKDDITMILQKAKPACCRDGIFHSTTEVTVSAG